MQVNKKQPVTWEFSVLSCARTKLDISVSTRKLSFVSENIKRLLLLFLWETTYIKHDDVIFLITEKHYSVVQVCCFILTLARSISFVDVLSKTVVVNIHTPQYICMPIVRIIFCNKVFLGLFTCFGLLKEQQLCFDRSPPITWYSRWTQ